MRSRVPPTPQSLPEHFAASEELSPLVAKVARLTRLQRKLVELVPIEMAPSCRVANLRDGQVIVWVTGNATAAKLKLLLPRLVEGFISVCADVKGVKLEVQFLSAPTGGARQVKRAVLAPPSALLDALAANLPPSPLADVVRSIAAKGRR